MSIAQRVEIENLKSRVTDLEKIVLSLRESLADLQGEKIGKQLAARDTLTLKKQPNA